VIGLSRGLSVYAFTEAVDMRKSFNTLSALVAEQMKRDVLTGDLFLFVSADRKRARFARVRWPAAVGMLRTIVGTGDHERQRDE
jgi:hypothetical protein